MDQDINALPGSLSVVCLQTMRVTNHKMEINPSLDGQWEMNSVNDVSMSDINRAVNAFIAGPGSSMMIPKQDPDSDCFFQSNTNNKGMVHSTSNTLGSRSFQSVSGIDEEVNVRGNLQTNKVEDGEIYIPLKAPVQNIVEESNVMKLRSNTRKRQCSNHDRGMQLRSSARNIVYNNDNRYGSPPEVKRKKYRNGSEAGDDGRTELSSWEEQHTSDSEVSKDCTIESSRSSEMENKTQVSNKKAAGLWSSSKAFDSVDSTFVFSLFTKKSNRFQCNMCDKNYAGRFSMKRHLKSHTGKCTVTKRVRIKQSEDLYCTKCGKRFGRRSDFKQHENVHKGVKPYKCKICTKRFHTNRNKCSHVRLKHVEPYIKMQCEICGVVGNGTYMAKHKATVHIKKRYKCNECKEDFRKPCNLRDHMRMHRGEERHKCDICPSSFVMKSALKMHIKGHSVKLPCPKCDKVFKSKNYLKFHLLHHEGIKRFCCNECGKTFSHSHYLTAHKLSHGEKGFECAICGGKFNRKDNLKAHIKRHESTGKKDLRKK